MEDEPSAIPVITEAFSAMIGLLHTLIARDGEAGLLKRAFTILVCERLRRIARRILVLLSENPVQTDKAPPRPQSTPSTDRTDPKTKIGPLEPLPTHRAWLRNALEYARSEAATVTTGGLRRLLDEPDLIARIKTDPRLGRAMRPLYRMLGIDWPAHLEAPQPTHHSEPATDAEPPDLIATPRIRRPKQPRKPRPEHGWLFLSMFDPPIFDT